MATSRLAKVFGLVAAIAKEEGFVRFAHDLPRLFYYSNFSLKCQAKPYARGER